MGSFVGIQNIRYLNEHAMNRDEGPLTGQETKPIEFGAEHEGTPC